MPNEYNTSEPDNQIIESDGGRLDDFEVQLQELCDSGLKPEDTLKFFESSAIIDDSDEVDKGRFSLFFQKIGISISGKKEEDRNWLATVIATASQKYPGLASSTSQPWADPESVLVLKS